MNAMPASPQKSRPTETGNDLLDWQIDAGDIARYRAMLKKQQSRDESAGNTMEIDGNGRARSLVRTIAWGLLMLATAAVFTLLFFRFTANLRVALVVVLAMLLYMLVTARMAEGRFDSRN